MIKSMLLVAVGGAIGSIFRFLCSMLFINKQHIWPWPTFIVNMLGCFLVGAIYSYIQKYGDAAILHKLLIVGFCGGFTTFSAFSLESWQYISNGQYLLLFSYILVSVLFGLGLLITGIKLFS